jgi:nitroreductase
LDYVSHAEEHPDFPFPERYEGVFQERRRECAWQLYDAVGVTWGDRVASRRQTLENFRFFGAPSVAVITTEAALGLYGALDCGVYAGNFMIAAQSLGLATIALASLASHSQYFHERLNLPEHRKIIVGMAFGYPDLRHPVNSFRTSRVDLDEARVRLR